LKNETVKMKLCRRCRTVKPAKDFYRNKRNSSTGLSSYCKKCKVEYTRLWKTKNRERSLTWKRNWRENNKDRDALHKRRHRQKHPDRAKARNLLSWAIHTKKIKPQPCRSCGAVENIEGHHHDYSKPYDVIWLCSDCHKAVHRNLDRIKKQSAKQKHSVPVQAPTGERSIQIGVGV